MFGRSNNDRSHNNTWSPGRIHGASEPPHRSMFGHSRDIRSDKEIRVFRPGRRNDGHGGKHRGVWI